MTTDSHGAYPVPGITVRNGVVYGPPACEYEGIICERPARSWCPDCLVPLDACAKPHEHDEEAIACNEHRHAHSAEVRGMRPSGEVRS